MVGIWLDNPKNPPSSNPYTNAAGIAGDPSYIRGYAILAAYHAYAVINSGGITSPTFGIGLEAGGSVTNQSGGNINASLNGVNIQGGGSVTNATGGTIAGGSRSVVVLGPSGTIVNQATAAIVGAFEGADLEAGGLVSNAGTIVGNYAIVARSGAIVSITATGQVSGASDGVFLGQPGYTPAIFGGATNGKVFNQGLITASGSGGLSNGVVLNVASAFVNNSGTITGKDATGKAGLGIALNYGGSLLNTGMIAGGLAGFSAGGNPVTKGSANIINNGSISGSKYGVRLWAGGFIQNSGLITGTGYNGLSKPKYNSGGIRLVNGGTVANSGTVYATQNAIYGAKGITVTNSGKIMAGATFGSEGVQLIGGGAVTNAAGATISAGMLGVYSLLPGATTVVNSGTIQVSSQATGSSGVNLGTGPSDSVTNQSGATISGDYAVRIGSGGTLANYGVITGVGTAHATGLWFSTGGVINNSPGATISGVERGAYLINSRQTPTNLTNFGVIKATGANGVGLKLGDVRIGRLTNESTGYISGTSYGVLVTAPNDTTFTTYGTIAGGKFAIKLPAKSSNSLQISPSASFSGTIDLGQGSDSIANTSLVLLSSQIARGVIGGLGGTVINAGTVIFNPGGQWTVEGTASAFTGGQTFSGFAPGDTLDLAGATNESITGFDNNTLSLAGGDAKLNIVIPGSFTAASFSVSNDQIGGSIVKLTAKPPKQIGWVGGQSNNNIGFAANWGDFTNGQNAGAVTPTATDNVWFMAGGGQLTGTGSAAALLFGGPDQWVVGPSTQFTAAGAGGVTVGQGGAGSLALTGGGVIISQGAMDTVSGAMSASLSVTGVGSDWTSNGGLLVGGDGTGSLAIQAGGQVSAGAGLVLANTANAAGSEIDVDGAGSGLAVTGLLNVAPAGSGVLNLSHGATASAGSLDVAGDASATGNVELTDAGTRLTVSGAATVADDGTGVFSVLNGATFGASSLTVGAQEDSSGAVFVSGADSVVQLSGALNIGTALGIGDLTVGPGAAVHASVVNLQGQVVLEGGLLDPTVQLINQGQTVGGFGTIAAGDIVDEGVIQAGANKASQKLLLVQGNLLGGGTLTVDGSQPGSNAAGILQINAGGTMELTGAVLNAATTTFTDNLTPMGTYTVNNSVMDVTFADAAGVLKLDDIAGFAGTITTFHAGDSFVITGGTLSSPNVVNGNTLTFADSGANAGAGGIDSIIFASPVSAAGFNVVNNTVQVACFAEGTLIETETGPVAVEALRVGQSVLTHDGQPQPIVWLGQRTLRCDRHPRPETVWPVCVRAEAFGENVPRRDLYLSPDHAVFVDGVLIPVKLLGNGASIIQVKRDRVRYFHVELPRHDVILAEGLPTESYLDAGDRQTFSGGPVTALYPDFVARRWEMAGCAPLVLTGAELEAIRSLLSERDISPDRNTASG